MQKKQRKHLMGYNSSLALFCLSSCSIPTYITKTILVFQTAQVWFLFFSNIGIYETKVKCLLVFAVLESVWWPSRLCLLGDASGLFSTLTHVSIPHHLLQSPWSFLNWRAWDLPKWEDIYLIVILPNDSPLLLGLSLLFPKELEI